LDGENEYVCSQCKPFFFIALKAEKEYLNLKATFESQHNEKSTCCTQKSESGKNQKLNTSCASLQTPSDNDKVSQLSEPAHLICVVPELTKNGEEQQLNTSCLQTPSDNDEVRQLSESAHLISVVPVLTENGEEQQLNTSCLQTPSDNDEVRQLSESAHLI